MALNDPYSREIDTKKRQKEEQDRKENYINSLDFKFELTGNEKILLDELVKINEILYLFDKRLSNNELYTMRF